MNPSCDRLERKLCKIKILLIYCLAAMTVVFSCIKHCSANISLLNEYVMVITNACLIVRRRDVLH